MEIEQIIGNSIMGIEKRISKESSTITYAFTIFPFSLNVATGIEWNYYEISIEIIPLFQISINTLLHE